MLLLNSQRVQTGAGFVFDIFSPVFIALKFGAIFIKEQQGTMHQKHWKSWLNGYQNQPVALLGKMKKKKLVKGTKTEN